MTGSLEAGAVEIARAYMYSGVTKVYACDMSHKNAMACMLHYSTTNYYQDKLRLRESSFDIKQELDKI